MPNRSHLTHDTTTHILVAMSAIIVILAVHQNNPDAENTSTWFGCGLVWVVVWGLVACAVLALKNAGRIPDGLAGRIPAFSHLHCVGLLGWQLFAVLHRTTSSVEELRGSTALLRGAISSRLLLPPFAVVGAAYLVLGAGMGFQQLPLFRKLQVTCFEIVLFTLGPMLMTRPR